MSTLVFAEGAVEVVAADEEGREEHAGDQLQAGGRRSISLEETAGIPV